MRRQKTFFLVSLFIVAPFCKLDAQNIQAGSTITVNSPREKDVTQAQNLLQELPGFTNKLNKINLNALIELENLELSILEKISSRTKTELPDELAKGFKPFSDLKEKLASADVLNEFSRASYLGKLDSVYTLFTFVGENLSFNPSQIDLLKGNFDQFNTVLRRSEAINAFLKNRISRLSNLADKYNIKKQVSRLKLVESKLGVGVAQIKNSINNPKNIAPQLYEWIKGSPKFQEFFRRNSEIARLVGGQGQHLTGDNTSSQIPNLQSRKDLSRVISQRLGKNVDTSGNFGLPDIFKTQMKSSGYTDFSKVQEISELGQMKKPVSDKEDQKIAHRAKPFQQKIRYGTNFQLSRSSYYFPTTATIGAYFGYELSTKSVIGIGAGYMVGFGKSWQNIRISSEGASLRSFGDIKIRGSIWLTAAAEWNYRSQINNFGALKNYSSWQKSALAGLTKTYRVGSSMKGSIQIFYDFLSSKQVPQTQPFLFRVGYGF